VYAEEGAKMRAEVGDRLVVKGPHVGDHEREGEIVEIRHEDGSPPYVVRWSDSGQESLYFPGPDAAVQHPGGGNGSPQES
jgi:hypothetical protein